MWETLLVLPLWKGFLQNFIQSHIRIMNNVQYHRASFNIVSEGNAVQSSGLPPRLSLFCPWKSALFAKRYYTFLLGDTGKCDALQWNPTRFGQDWSCWWVLTPQWIFLKRCPSILGEIANIYFLCTFYIQTPECKLNPQPLKKWLPFFSKLTIVEPDL